MISYYQVGGGTPYVAVFVSLANGKGRKVRRIGCDCRSHECIVRVLRVMDCKIRTGISFFLKCPFLLNVFRLLAPVIGSANHVIRAVVHSPIGIGIPRVGVGSAAVTVGVRTAPVKVWSTLIKALREASRFLWAYWVNS